MQSNLGNIDPLMTPAHKNDLSRRRFLARGVAGAAALGAVRLSGRQAQAAAKTPKTSITPYTDSLKGLRKTDPKLLLYELESRFPCAGGEPKRVGFGPDGQLFVAIQKTIVRFTPDGRQESAWTLPAEVRAFSFARDGTLYAALLDHIEVYDVRGAKSATWEAPARKAWLCGLAVGETHVFATDASNRIVHRFDRSGKLAGQLGAKDPARKILGFVVPSPYFDLELGADNQLWVANPGHHRVEAYDLDGNLQSFWGQPSFGMAGFCGCCNPSYFARTADGSFITSEKGLTRVKVYSAKGDFQGVVAGTEDFPKYADNLNASPIAMDVAVDSQGRVFVADTLGREIRVYRKKAAA